MSDVIDNTNDVESNPYEEVGELFETAEATIKKVLDFAFACGLLDKIAILHHANNIIDDLESLHELLEGIHESDKEGRDE